MEDCYIICVYSMDTIQSLLKKIQETSGDSVYDLWEGRYQVDFKRTSCLTTCCYCDGKHLSLCKT